MRQILTKNFKKIFVLTRGYKGTAKGDGKRMADAEWSATIVDKN